MFSKSNRTGRQRPQIRHIRPSHCALFTDRDSREGKAMASVGRSVRLSVCLSVCPSVSTLYLFTDWPLNSSLCLCAWVMTIARIGLKVKVIGQGQRSMSSEYGRGNAVTRSVWHRSSIEDSFYPHMLISKAWIYRLLFVCVSVCLCVCTVTDFSAEDEASGVKFCTAVHRRPRQEISHFGVLCSARSPKSDESRVARALANLYDMEIQRS